MDILLEASKVSGLSVEELNKIIEMLVKRGNFSTERITQELYTFCVKIGMVQYYFKTTPIETIANHIESISAAEIIALNRGGKTLEVDFVSEREDSALYLINDAHQKGVEIERRMEKQFPIYRMQSYRTAGLALESHFRSYFVQKPEWIEANPAPNEDDIYKVAAKQFIDTTTKEAIDRYQRVLRESMNLYQPYIEVTDPVRDEIRIMVAIPQWDGDRFLSGISDIINYYGLCSKHKYVEPFSNGRLIMSLYLDAASARPYIEDIVTDISLITIHPESDLSSLIRSNTLSVHEAFYALGAWNFTHQFLSSWDVEYVALMDVLKDKPDLLDILHRLRTRLLKDSYTENRILQTIQRFPDEIKRLYDDFSKRFATGSEESSHSTDVSLSFEHIPHEIDVAILNFFMLFNKTVLKTNFYKKNKVSLAFRLDPVKFLDPLEYSEKPFGVFMILAKEFRGFHVRFRDIARGGIRIVKSRDPESYDLNSDSIFDENYNLAFTQQKKNKDIPEGGSKGTILLNLKYQNKGEIAFQKYVDGLLDVILPGEISKDLLNRDEILFLGPDEGTAEMMSWASKRANERGYKFWKSFSTGKSLEEGGIPHDLYGMTTNSVHEYVLGILEKLGLKEENVTKVQTGGPDGDLGSNEILISKDKTICVIDGSGVLYDPEGLDRTELTRLAQKRVMIEKFDQARLSRNGFLVHINDKDKTLPDGTQVVSGLEFRNNFHLNPMIKADIFIPCGGRPNSINIQNWRDLLDENGVPRFKIIVEGANLFLSQPARLALAKKGIIIIKDASANKGGVTSSSLEVLASLAMTDDEYDTNMCVKGSKVPEYRKHYVQDVLTKIRQNARDEFEVLWNEYKRTNAPLAILSDQLSDKINKIADSVHNSDLCKDPSILRTVVEEHCPPSLIQKLGIETILKRVPVNYLQAIVSSWLGSHFIYEYGLDADEINFYHFLHRFTCA
ncbi:NAD-glutamate dehydrogenase [candidate division KSB1 bacterium]|nr:NAD-glutamate dehydrogenase [candidate division KSB1 bacterium]